MKLKHISRQLLKNYIFIMIIIITLGLTTFFLNLTYTNSKINNSIFDIDQFLFDYNSGFDYALSKQNLEKEDFLIVFDNDYTVVDVYNYYLNKDDQLDDLEFEMIYDNEDQYSYYTFESDDAEYIFLLYLAPVTTNVMFVILIASFAIITFIIFTFFLAKKTGKNIIRPLMLISQGVKEISNGNYNHIIQFETSNELDDIRDDINHMSLQLKHEIERRKQLENERNQLILSLSHDIKTPLTNVIGYSQMLLNQPIEDDNFKQSVEIINKYGLTAAALTDELFDFTKLNMDYQHMITERLDIVEVIRLKLIEYVNEFETLHINYQFNLPSTPIYTQLNRMNFYRVLDNLLQNSINYNHQSFDLTVDVVSTDKEIRITVEDTGIGIPLTYHQTIFNPMVRVESSRNRNLGGTGLGLSIAKQIMLNHNGDITIDSDYTKGCRFILILPIRN
ncbi:MAG: HAMP domain-containing histidine kinase [Clostridiales bacterium]|nr:HAMP domain-containing histidine kinase [Clostridiales bacterium]